MGRLAVMVVALALCTPAAAEPARSCGPRPLLEGSAWAGLGTESYRGTRRLETAFRIRAGALLQRCERMPIRLGLTVGSNVMRSDGDGWRESVFGVIEVGAELEIGLPDTPVGVVLGGAYGTTLEGRAGLRYRTGLAYLGVDVVATTGASVDFVDGPAAGVLVGVGGTGWLGIPASVIAGALGFAVVSAAISGGD